jgi:uncharacterized protein
MANEKQMDSELIEELQQRLEALNNEGVMDAGVIDGFLTAYALNPEHPSKHDIYPYIFSEEGDPAALPEDDRILELLDIRLNEIQAALAAKGGLDPVIFPLVDDNDEIITDEEGIEALEPWASGFFFGMMHWREDLIADDEINSLATPIIRNISPDDFETPEEAEHIFVPFFTTKEGGSGIGLSISRQIMRLSGGSIALRSNPAQRQTTFVLTFP